MNEVCQKLLDEAFGFKSFNIVARIIESKGEVASSVHAAEPHISRTNTTNAVFLFLLKFDM